MRPLRAVLEWLFPEQRVLQTITIAVVLLACAAVISGLLCLTILPKAVAIGTGPVFVLLGLVYYWMRRRMGGEGIEPPTLCV